MDSVIQVQNLKKTYPLPKRHGTLEVLKGVSFEVKKGEIFGVLGPNGAGKTTLLEIIEGLRQQDEGNVTVLGFDNLKHTDEIKRRIGVQLQHSDYLPHLSLGELLDLFASLYLRGPSSNKNTTLSNLKLVGLEDKINETVKSLSGGQKQRFTLATALVHNPQILFLDEPTTGLDPAARRDFWQLIKDLNASGLTIVLITHYMEEAEYLCHRVAIMDQGTILKISEPRKLIDDLSHTTQISFFFESPLEEKIFQDFPGIEKIYNRPPKIILEIKSLKHVSKIMEALKHSKIKFSGFTLKTASLEDVYLDLTGHEFEDN